MRSGKMKNILNLLQKFRSKVKRDGIFKAFKKGFVKLYYSYYNKIKKSISTLFII